MQGLKLGLFFIPARHIGGDFIDFVCFNGTDESGVVFADITATVFQPLCSRMFKVFIDDVLHSKTCRCPIASPKRSTTQRVLKYENLNEISVGIKLLFSRGSQSYCR